MPFLIRTLAIAMILLNWATAYGGNEDLLVAITPPPPPVPSGVAIPEAKRNRLIEALCSDSENVKSHAEQHLLKAGPSAVAALKSAVTGQPNRFLPFVPPLLEQFVRHADAETAWAAADALTELTKSQQAEIKNAATESLQYCRIPLRERVIWRIRELGGIVNLSRDLYDVDDRTGELTRVISNVAIDENWKGELEDISFIERTPDFHLVYLIDGHPLSQDTIDELQRRLPKLRIETRGRVQLGIRANFDEADVEGVTVFDVDRTNSAYKAGLRASDVITELDGKRIESFPKLVKTLKAFKPGDVVKLVFVRTLMDEPIEIEIDVALDGWDTEE